MAIKIYEKFAPRANPADGDYPYGSIKNESVPGAKDGTPLDAEWGNDMVGFTDALLAEAGVVPNGQPDKLGASQRVDAMMKIFRNKKSYGDVVFVADFGAVSDGVTDDTLAVVAAINSLPSTGGALVFPVGNTKITNMSTAKSISIIGFGYTSVLTIDSITLTPPQSDTIMIKDIKIETTGAGNGVVVNQTWLSTSQPCYETNKVWFNSLDGTGDLFSVYGARESGVSECWFSSNVKNNLSTTVGIKFIGDNVGGAMNIDVTTCKFYDIGTGIAALGTVANFQFLAGLRIINNMFIGLKRGVYVENADYIQIEQNMFDFVREPVLAEFVPNLKIRNNYLASSGELNDAIAVTNDNPAVEMQWLDISGNRIFSYAPTNKGNAVSVTAKSGSVTYGLICNNNVDLVENAVVLGSAGAGKVSQITIDGNKARASTSFLLFNTGAELCDATNNFAETNVTNFIVDNNIGGLNRYNIGNKYGIKRSENRGKLIANGDGANRLFTISHECINVPLIAQVTQGVEHGGYQVYYDATTLYVEFLTAPLVGVNNVVINWAVSL